MAQRAGIQSPRSFAGMIEAERTRTPKIPKPTLHRIYWDLGGRMEWDTFSGYFRGKTEPSVTDGDLIIQAINYARGKQVLRQLLELAPVPPEGGAVSRGWVARESNPKPTGHKSVVLEIAAA